MQRIIGYPDATYFDQCVHIQTMNIITTTIIILWDIFFTQLFIFNKKKTKTKPTNKKKIKKEEKHQQIFQATNFWTDFIFVFRSNGKSFCVEKNNQQFCFKTTISMFHFKSKLRMFFSLIFIVLFTGREKKNSFLYVFSSKLDISGVCVC